MALRTRHQHVGPTAWRLMLTAGGAMHHLLTVPLRADPTSGWRDLAMDALLIIVPYSETPIRRHARRDPFGSAP